MGSRAPLFRGPRTSVRGLQRTVDEDEGDSERCRSPKSESVLEKDTGTQSRSDWRVREEERRRLCVRAEGIHCLGRGIHCLGTLAVKF